MILLRLSLATLLFNSACYTMNNDKLSPQPTNNFSFFDQDPTCIVVPLSPLHISMIVPQEKSNGLSSSISFAQPSVNNRIKKQWIRNNKSTFLALKTTFGRTFTHNFIINILDENTTYVYDVFPGYFSLPCDHIPLKRLKEQMKKPFPINLKRKEIWRYNQASKIIAAVFNEPEICT
jgi:hypothetical protein